MASIVRPRRALLRALLVLSVGGTVFAGLPDAESSAAPASVVRTATIDVAGLLARGLTLAPDGALVAGTRAPSRAVTSCAPIWFDGIAVTWRQDRGRPPTLSVATGGRRDALAAPVRVDEEGGPDPGTADARSAARGSDYLWVGGARCVRLRFQLPRGASIASVRVAYLNTSGTSAGPGTGPADVGPSLGGAASMPAANATTARPNFITREHWGANPRLMNCTPDVASFLTNAFVHHTAGSNGYSRSQADDVVRGIYAYHTQVRGWCDIGYNFLVDRYGDVFEGRSGGVTNDVIGAAQMGFNTGAFSVAVMGTFDVVAPPLAAVHALERVLAWRLDVAHVNPATWQRMTSAGGSTTRYKKGTTVRLHAISGHRDTGLTDCPGARLYPLLPSIRRVVARTGLPKFYDPRISTTTLVAGEPAAVRIKARGSTTLVWTVTVLDPTSATVAELPPQRSDRLDVRWDAALTTPGRYDVVIAAATPKGAAARPAFLPLSVAAVPSPSPSSTPTTTPTPPPTLTPTPTVSSAP
ncbi:MAG TPA: N-acetylmuramoyl-L-alanine amidase [Actinomycetota bacterium]|nr:N-acetylmuramoyl-L-alanine amidase [Actinomycetota bacterium]